MIGRERVDTRLLAELTEQSQDLNSDAMRISRDALRGYGGPPRSRSAAANAADVMALQTAASIENLAVNVYTTAAGLPFIKTGNATVSAFIAKTTTQHSAHAKAFNAAAVAAGGKAQTQPNPKYAAIVKQALPTIAGPADVVKLAITLEDVAAQTYTAYVSQVTDPQLRKLFGSVAPVEAQHRAVLLAVQALLAAGHPELIALPVDAAKLPASAGGVGFPDAFYPVKNASPVSEGAVQ